MSELFKESDMFDPNGLAKAEERGDVAAVMKELYAEMDRKEADAETYRLWDEDNARRKLLDSADE